MQRFKSRIIAALLALTIGIGVDTYLRNEDVRTGPHCWGCRSWSCTIVGVADNPTAYARVLWYRLTD